MPKKPAKKALAKKEMKKTKGGIIAVEYLPPAPEVVSPRDPASGLPTGKRTHKPFQA